MGKTDIEGKRPYENSGIQEGDMIIEINKKTISSTNELIECVSECNGENLIVKYMREGKEIETSMIPAKTSLNEYKLGLWVRDGAAGIGTITYYEPSTGKFVALRTSV